MAYEIVKRRLTASEADVLYKEIKTTPNILGLTRGEWRAFKDVWVAEKDGQMAGVCANRDLPLGWSEVAALYVLPEHRAHGLGRQLFELAFDDLVKRRRDIYVISRNPAIIKMMEERRMRFLAIERMPLGITLFNLAYMAQPYRGWEMLRKQMAFRGDRSGFRGAILCSYR